jgi:protein-S-isoprenylcysteine O-methyltransferase Ste14
VAALALSLAVLYAVALFGVGEVAQRRRTGVAGWVRSTSSPEHAANMLVLAAWLLAMLGPALVLACGAEPWFGGSASAAAGIALSCASLGGAVLAQQTMGSAWRAGIDPAHPSGLVTRGVFALVRNPVYTTMVGLSVGVWLLAPTAAGALAVLVCIAGLEIQTRAVEEPYLRELHGQAYTRYAAETGRFVPGIGRLRIPSR